MKWCSLYDCWCDEVEDIIDEEDIVCDFGCNGCQYCESVEKERGF